MWTPALLCALLAGLWAPAAAETALTLARSNFTAVLGALPPATDAVVEFYASWCPACRHFQPTFEQLAVHLASQPAPTVVLTRLDCAVEV